MISAAGAFERPRILTDIYFNVLHGRDWDSWFEPGAVDAAGRIRRSKRHAHPDGSHLTASIILAGSPSPAQQSPFGTVA